MSISDSTILAGSTKANQKSTMMNLMGKEYIVYLKEVPTKIAPGGTIEATTIRPFIREVKKKSHRPIKPKDF